MPERLFVGDERVFRFGVFHVRRLGLVGKGLVWGGKLVRLGEEH